MGIMEMMVSIEIMGSMRSIGGYEEKGDCGGYGMERVRSMESMEVMESTVV